MFGFMKKKKYDDFDDIRSDVIGAPRFEEAPRQLPPARPEFDVPERDFAPRFEEPPGFSSVDMRAPERSTGRDYDVLDKLNLIESQLAAIRSQTETINERLKTLEMKLSVRKY